MPRCPRAVSRPILLASAIGIIWAVRLAVPTGADLGHLVNRAAAWASPPRDDIRKMAGGGRYRAEKEREALREEARKAEMRPGFVGPPSQ